MIHFTGTGPAAAEPYNGLALILPTGYFGHLKTVANHVQMVIDSDPSTNRYWNSASATWDSGTPWIDGANSAASFSTNNGVFLGDASGVSGNPTISVNGASVSPGGVIMNSASRDYTITGVIAGNSSMTVNAPFRTLTLQAANTYVGATTINGGTLKLQNTGGSALSQTLSGPLNFAGPDVTLQSDKAGGGSISTTAGTPVRSLGTTANFVCTGGTPGTDNNIILPTGGVVGAWAFFNGADFALVNANNSYLRAPVYDGTTDTARNVVAVNTLTAAKHCKITSAGLTGLAAASVATVKFDVAGPATFALTPATADVRADGIIKAGGGELIYNAFGFLCGQAYNTDLIINTAAANDQLTVNAGSNGNGGSINLGTGNLFKSGPGTLLTTGSTTKKSATFTKLYLNGGTYQADLGFNDGGNGTTVGAAVTLTYSSTISAAQGAQLFINFPSGASGYASMTISGVMSGGGSLKKGNTGNLILSGANTFSGETTINGGTLTLSGGGTLANTANIIVGSGAGFNVSAPTTALTLGSGQTLQASATGATTTGTITVATGKNLTLGGTTTGLAFTAFGGGATAPLTVAGTGGSLDLNSKPVAVTTTATLTAGAYKLIAKSGSAAVTGTPGTLTVGGSGGTATLRVTSGELFMDVTAGSPTISATGTLTAMSTTYGTASTAQSFSLSGTNMAASITVTPPAGFEVSQTSSTTGFAGGGNAITVGSSGTIASTAIYVRLAATTSAGTYSGNVACSSSGATTVNVATASSTVLTAYDTWANGTFANAFTDKLPGSNPDGDTLTNLQEFAFGTDPTVSSTGPITWSGAVVTAHGTPVVIEESSIYYGVYGRRVSYVADGLTYTRQFSPGLSVWGNFATTQTVIATDGTIEAVKVPFPDLFDYGSGPQKATFFRMGVSQ